MLGGALKANSGAKAWLQRSRSKDRHSLNPDSASSSSSDSEQDEEPRNTDHADEMAQLQRMLTENEQGLESLKRKGSLLSSFEPTGFRSNLPAPPGYTAPEDEAMENEGLEHAAANEIKRRHPTNPDPCLRLPT